MKSEEIILLCKRKLPSLYCEQYLGTTIRTANSQFRINGIRFDRRYHHTTAIIAEVTNDNSLCGLIPKSCYVDKDLFDVFKTENNKYIIIRKRN